MKKKFSAYWWCQVIGWSIPYATLLFLIYITSPDSIINFIPLFFSSALLGILTTHLIRILILKSGILDSNIFKQVLYIFLTTFFFSFIHALIIEKSGRIFGWDDELSQFYPTKRNITFLTFNNCFFLGMWNLIYFSYHYIQKSRYHLIEKTRLESELKIQQLENDNTKLHLQKNLADISLAALRSQMNPHFIFNCLNSIKLYTAQNDTVAATEYLSKFSKLIRLVMEESAKEKILLSAELNMLQLYVEMEAMRFKEKLQYEINVDKDVETDYIELPPMLLQPYVENAIWHGLMPKEEGGKIDIDIAVDNYKSLLTVVIIDNGIGRAKSAELKNKSAVKHESFGMKVTSERLALINQTYKTGADIMVLDLLGDNKKPSGTKVIIQIPV